jgi:hypothetical protein
MATNGRHCQPGYEIDFNADAASVRKDDAGLWVRV